ncbi:hypothetical protein [Niallia sp. FSL M8-0099]|uniref:hypothetical protein n=1 Tax=Niallia sp. FSL M8-0099 TaxID=2954519 RepID=UPI0030FCE555
MAKEQPKVHTIDGKQYVEVERNVRVDDLILIVAAVETYDMYNNGDILIVGGIADNGVYSESAEYHAPGSGNRDGFIADSEFVVIEPIDSEEEEFVTASADNPDQIIELLGNLARRVTELEQRVSQYNALFRDLANQSGEKFTAKQVAEIIKALGVGAND